MQFLLAVLAYQVDFLIHVGGIAVEGYYYRLAVALQTLYVLVQVFKSLDEPSRLGSLMPSRLRRRASSALRGGYDDGEAGVESGFAALDVVELLGTQVGAESGFRNGIVAKGHGHAGGQYGVAAVGNVGKRAAVYNGRRVLGGLYQVGHDGVLEQHGDGTGNARSFTVNGRPSVVKPSRMFSMRRRRSSKSFDRHRMAMISEAGVMSNPDSLTTPLVLAPRPVTM